MGKESDVVQMTIRLEPAFHKACLDSAEEMGQTLAEWIRRAMKDKLERLTSGNTNQDLTDAELHAVIQDVVLGMKEKKII